MINNAIGNNPQATVDLKVFRKGEETSKQLVVNNFNYGGTNFSTTQKFVASGPASQRLGASIRGLTTDEVQKAGLADGTGFYVVSVDADSLAEQMGLKPSDYLLEINGIKLSDMSMLQKIVSTNAISVVKVWRDGNILSLNGVNKI
jgi:membrane-associated protease RseP (regulator of RpoE activity)